MANQNSLIIYQRVKRYEEFKEDEFMAIYYVQKKYRVDKDGAKHLNYNVTLPFEAILGMDVDGADRSERAVEVTYDDATQTVTIKKAV